jgi:hypothetical protein
MIAKKNKGADTVTAYMVLKTDLIDASASTQSLHGATDADKLASLKSAATLLKKKQKVVREFHSM